MTRSVRHGRGVALVLVLWVIALLTVMALGLTATQRTESTLTANAMDGARFRAAADAAIAYAAVNLLAPVGPDLDATQVNPDTASESWVPDRSPHRWTFAEVPLVISVENESSRIDLNAAAPQLLADLMVTVGAPYEDAQTLAARIVDWRDQDDLKELNGAEDPDYKAAGLSYGAKDAPFTSVEEMGEVLGMTADLYRRLAPYLTVDTGAGNVNQQFASATVLAAVQGTTLDQARSTVLDRAQPAFPGAVPGGIATAVGRGGPLYRIRVTRVAANAADGVQSEAGAGPSMEALVRIEQGGRPPYHLLWRRYGLLPPMPDQAPDEQADGGR